MRQRDAMEIALALHFREYDDAETVMQPSGQYAVRFTVRSADGWRVVSSLHDLVMLIVKKSQVPGVKL